MAGRERHVFRSRERGTSALDPKGGEFGPVPAGDWPAPPEGLVPGLGDAWAPGPPATSEGLWGAPGAASPSDSDEPGCLCPRYALAPSQPNCLAGCWWEGSWARVGDEAAQGRFLDARLAWVADMADGTARVSAGPAGPPDPSRMPLTAIPDHNGEAGEECRLTYVPGQSTTLPACLRVAAGNVVDAATLGRTFAELGAAGLPASWAVPGAGRWPAGNVRATGLAGTKFPARPGPNVRAHGDVVAERLRTVREADKLVAHGGRHACAGRPGAELVPGVRGWC